MKKNNKRITMEWTGVDILYESEAKLNQENKELQEEIKKLKSALIVEVVTLKDIVNH